MMRNCLNLVQGFHKNAIIAASLLLVMSFNVCAADDVLKIKSTDYPKSVLQSASSVNDPVSTGYLGQLVVGLVIVLLCIVALAWIARRFNRLQSTPDGSLRLLGGMSMGARERIVLVQVGTRQLLLGVAPGRINTLHVLDESLESFSDISDQSAGPLSSKSFADKLTAALTRNQRQ